MPEFPTLVDVEAVLLAFVAADAGVTALDAEVAAEVPASFPSSGAPFVQLFRVGGTDAGSGHLDRAVVQVNGYGSSRPEAFDVLRAAFGALLRATTAALDDAVVSDVLRLSGPTWSPDPITDAPRYTLSAAVTVHPTTV